VDAGDAASSSALLAAARHEILRLQELNRQLMQAHAEGVGPFLGTPLYLKDAVLGCGPSSAMSAYIIQRLYNTGHLYDIMQASRGLHVADSTRHIEVVAAVTIQGIPPTQHSNLAHSCCA
jgi:hypothetical protein